MNPQIEQAIERFRCSGAKYAKTERYYRGDHDLAFATEKFVNAFGSLFREFAMNLCPAICDAVRDKLRVTGFGVNASEPPALEGGRFDQSRATTSADWPPAYAGGSDLGLRGLIDRIWFRNRMAERAGEIHKEALKNGDAYAVVWFDPRGEVTIYPHRAGSVAVEYDEEQPGRIVWAAKYWRTADKHTRINIFYPDRIERYVTRKATEVVLPEASDFVAVGSPRPNVQSPRPKNGPWTLDVGPGTISNPFGMVPVFHFANNADVGCMGQSELAAAIPIQDGLIGAGHAGRDGIFGLQAAMGGGHRDRHR